MSIDHHRRVKEIFLAACDRQPDEREAYLDEACGSNASLRDEVESLLAFHEDGAALLSDTKDEEVPPGKPGPRESIAGYRILHEIGEGGMGEVYEAEQLEPVRRKVAVKVIKAGMDSRAVLARFESERQALAMMDHPAIARVYDAGTTERGRPFFAMELIGGEPITRYCDRHRLSTRERLELFIQLCDGVQHAHQKGIIHRDIKPSNVLVRVLSGRPVPTIIDFGIAKASQRRLTGHSMQTAMGVMIGTPQYMSPEQAQLTSLDIDTRSDVYALGVMLYELLVGALPFEWSTERDESLDEIRRRIREDEPSKPSTKLTTLGEAGSGAAERRRTDPRGLRRQLKGDLDWITMKALEKDRTRRYESAAELGADIGRHLRHEPVLAGPPGVAYRTAKFVRRHRTGVAAGAALLVVLLIGIVGTTSGLLQARREAETARRVSAVLSRLFDDMNPFAIGEKVGDPAGILDRSAQRIEEELAEEPLARAQLMLPLGNAYWGIGRFEDARRLYEESLALRRAHLGNEHADVAESLARLGDFLYEMGEYDGAIEHLEEALAIWRRVRGPEDPLVGRSLRGLGSVYWKRSDLGKARFYQRQALAIEEKAYGPEHVNVSLTLHFLGLIELDAGDPESALDYLERSLRIRESVLGPQHMTVSSSLGQIGRAHLAAGDLERAESNLRRAVSIVEEAGGPDHPNLGLELLNLGRVLLAREESVGARECFDRALENQERNKGPDHPDLAYTLHAYGRLLLELGDLEGARDRLERAISILEQAFGSEHLDIARASYTLAYVEYEAGNVERSRRHFEHALASNRKVFGSDHHSLVGPLFGLACLSARSGDKEAALARLHEAIDCGLSTPDLLWDRELDSLRGDPEFDSLVREVRQAR